MALTNYSILTNYMTGRNLISRPDAADTWRRLTKVLSEVLVYHASQKEWNFRRGADTLITDSNAYKDSTVLTSIRGASLATVGELQLIGEAEYQKRIKINTQTTDLPTAVYIKGARIYPCLQPTSGLSIDVWGLLAMANAAAVLAVLPDNHESLMRILLDEANGIKPVGSYRDSANGMYQQECIGRTERIQEDRFWANIDAAIGT